LLNSYEIAILRILVKRSNQPIAIHSLIDGFPDGSEKQVADAISNLNGIKLVNILSGFPIEEKYIVYSLEKKNEILKLIDPFPNKETAGKYNDSNVLDHNNKNNGYTTANKVYPERDGTYRLPAIAMSIVFIITSLFLINAIPEVNEINHVFFYKKHSNDFKHKGGDGNGDFRIDKDIETGEAYGNGYQHYPKNMNANTTDWTIGEGMRMVEDPLSPDRLTCKSI
jgi:hypothetical protein